MSRTFAFVRRGVITGALLGWVTGCADSAPPPPEQQVALGGDVAARVGPEVITVSLVAEVAAAQRVAPREALRRLIDDALAANGARSRGRDRQAPASWLLTAARARWIADRWLVDARQGGPPADAEIAELTRLHWREVDRPQAVHVVHALAQRPKAPDETLAAEAREIARAIHAAVLSAASADDFEANAKAVPHPGVDVIVQRLPAFASDGAVTEGEGQMAEPFAKASHALRQVGDTSGVVESSFGWHVIRLVDRIPEQRMPFEARRAAFTEETYMQRARRVTGTRLAALRATTPVELTPSSEQLMESLLTKRGPSP